MKPRMNLYLLNLPLAGFVLLASSARMPAQDSRPEQPTAVEPSSAPASTNQALLEDAETQIESGSTNQAKAKRQFGILRNGRRHRSVGNEDVIVGRDVVVKRGETVDELVVVSGSATVQGKVRGDVVVVRGDLDLDGEVGGDAVVVMGHADVRTNANVAGGVLAIVGGVNVESKAKVQGDVVALGGNVETSDDASIHGQVIPVPIPIDLDEMVKAPNWFRRWVTQCVYRLRPLAPSVGWVWGVAAFVFLFYLAIAAVFRRPIGASVEELSRRPAMSCLTGVVSLVLTPLTLLVLALTGVGLLIVPFVILAFCVGAVFGKVALIQWIGVGLGRQFQMTELQKPLVGFLAGFAILTVLYTIPVLGLLTLTVTSIWGLGAAVLSVFGGFRREMPEKPAASPPSAAAPAVPPVLESVPAGASTAEVPSQAAAGEGPAVAPMSSAVPPLREDAASSAISPPVMPDLLAYPKAGFWERMGAAFLDVILVCILGSMIGNALLAYLVALAYFSAMWTWKATTIGGIVLGLKVVRLDAQPVTFAVGLVRGLAGAFSIMVLFLGILWIVWDKDKQGWHDRIAGTVVLKMPKGTPLICL